MNIIEAKEDFIKSLRVALNCVSIYFKEHPLVKNSIENLNQKIKILSSFVDPIEISITPSTIFFGKESFAQSKLSQELAEFFHFRKLKKIIFSTKTLTADELISFIYILAKPPRDIFKEGGMEKLIKINEIVNISVEELDYSHFLEVDAEKYKDIWEAILADIASNKDTQRYDEFINIFNKILNYTNTRELIQNNALRENIKNFLKYIKEIDNAKSLQFSKKLFHKVVSDKDILQDNSFYKLKELFAELKNFEIADIFCEEIIANKNFDQKSFIIFFHLFDIDTHKEISSLLKTKLKDLSSDKLFIKKIKDLFFSLNNAIPESYQPVLLSLSKDIFPTGQISLDYDALLKNYHFILMYLLDNIKSQKKINFIFEQLIKQTKFFIEKKEFEILKNLLVKLEQKESYLDAIKLDEFEKKIGFELEEMAIKGDISFDNIFLLDRIKESKYDFGFYLNLIFDETKINPSILYLFFKLYRNKQLFHIQLNKYRNDIKFLVKMIDNLSYIDLPESFETIKHIFFVSNDFVKHKALDAMERLSIYDKDFFYELLRSSDIYLKKVAFKILAKNTNTKKEAVKILLNIFNPLGIRNRILLENLKLIEEVPLLDIREDLMFFAKKNFFNRTIRQKIKKIIKM
ncbi:MAG: hypothetical protein NC918_01950 [Candidatus Omnitrophica bacterium]|nr:hypothetical protein [Candidatus Omnitrophota bacterium]